MQDTVALALCARRGPRRTPCLALLALLTALCAPHPCCGDAAADRLQRSVEDLSSVGSRVTGYPGCQRAAAWLRQELARARITEVQAQRFTVPVPVDEGFWLEVAATDSAAGPGSGAQGSPLRLYGVWPNLVRTSTAPHGAIAGRLLDAGRGALPTWSGQQVADRIVLLDYDSGRAWLEAFDLGARAVVFLDSGPSHRKESELKLLSVPAGLPRVYAAAADTARLRALARQGATVEVWGRMPWRDAEAQTLVGVVPGSDPELGHEAVLLQAHYDAMSAVPAVAPGAEQACSAAALLELGRQIAARPLRRTVLLVFTAGHYEMLAGARSLADLLEVVRDSSDAAGHEAPTDSATLRGRLQSLRIRLFVGLDLSTGSDVLGVLNPTDPYRRPHLAPPLTDRLLRLAGAYEDSALGGHRMLLNGLRADASRQHLGGLHLTLPLDAAAVALTGCPSLAFCTVNDSRAAFDTPNDRPERVNVARLERQVDFLEHVLLPLADDPELEPWEWGNDAFGVLRGKVLHFGARSYLADQPTAGALVRVRLRQPTLTGVRPDFWAVADDSGAFRVPGVETRAIYTQPVRLEAYGLDADTGVVTDAPDWGMTGERRLPGRRLTVLMDDQEETVEVVTAPLRALTLVDTFDPRHLLTPDQLQVLDAATEAEPPSFGGCLPLTPPEMEVFGYENRVGSWVEPAAVVFAPARMRVKVVMATGRFGLGRRLLLLNASGSDPAGEGYSVGEEERLPLTAYHVARDLTRLNAERLFELESHGVRNARLSAFHAQAARLLQGAEAARAAADQRAFLDQARQAWAYASAAYRDVQDTRSGVVHGALFLLAALLPFAHFAERLVFGFPDLRRQVLAYFAFFLAGFAALRWLHPAFELSLSPAVVLLGFVILALGVLVTAIGVARLNREVQALVAGRRGHRQVRRTGAMMASVALGLAHLRRRPMRTGLTCGTLVLLTFSVLSFTSIRSTLRANWVQVDGAATYAGALVRMPGWQPMEMSALALLRDRFGSERTAPRAWMGVPSLAQCFRLERDDRRAASVQGIAGLTAQEAYLTRPQEGLVAGRWLASGEQDACLLPEPVADSLGIGAAQLGQARVRLFGEVFTAVGILSPQALERTDLNNEPLTPLDPEAQKPAESEVGTDARGRTPVFAHLPGSATMVVPFVALMRWERARLASVALDLGGLDAASARAELERLSEVLDLDLFAGLEGRRFLVNTVGVASVAGVGSLLVPLAIAALIVLNTMLGAVYERTPEIGTLNAVGLAPAHVSGLFVAEAVAFGVIGAVLGYLLGQMTAQLAGRLGWLQGLELNYSSLAAAFTLGLVLVLVVASSLYPARLAGRLCTPGIERRWRPPAPQGQRLRMRLPFSLAQREAVGMAAFQAEFWAMHREQTIGAGFYVEDLRVRRSGAGLYVEGRVWLAPFDQGVVQQVVLTLAPGSEAAYWDIDVDLELLAGDFDTWRRVSRTFLDDLRKQFLVWRTLPEVDRRAYTEEIRRWETSGATVEPGP